LTNWWFDFGWVAEFGGSPSSRGPSLSIVSYVVSYLGLGLVLVPELVLDLGLGSLSILFIVRYFYLALGSIVLKINL
jgi:hypothetical protein